MYIDGGRDREMLAFLISSHILLYSSSSRYQMFIFALDEIYCLLLSRLPDKYNETWKMF